MMDLALSKMSGVYTIKTPSGRVYVGSAVSFGRRWSVHKCRMRSGTHDNKKLQSAWNKYGELLSFEPIIVCSKEDVIMYEKIAMKALSPCMNILPVAGSSIGYRHSEETKAKFKDRKKAGPKSPEIMAEQIRKVREAWRIKMSSGSYVHHSTKASKTAEAIAKQVASLAETNRKKRELNGGKVGNSRLGKEVSSESKRKMSESAKAAWAVRIENGTDKLGPSGRKTPQETTEKRLKSYAETVRKRKEAKAAK